MFQDFSPVIFQSPVCVLLMALVFARLLLENDVLYPCFLVVDSFAFVVRAEFQVGLHAEFSCKSPPEWIFSHLFNQALFACSQTMNKHISTQINAAKPARNEETRRRNIRVHNCQRSRFGFVARQLCGHHRNIYGPIEI